MDLTSLEHRFVQGITRTYRDEVANWLEEQPNLLESQKFTQKNRFAVLVISLFRYLKLAVELLVAQFSTVLQSDAIVFYEKDSRSVEKRVRFLEWNKPDTQFNGVFYDNTIRSIPDTRFVWRIMPLILGIIFASVLHKPSRLTPHLVRIVRTCLLTLDRAYASKTKTIYLFRIYRIETPFVSAFLKERGIKVHLVASSSPLSFYHRVLIGDSLKVCHPYQVDEFQHYGQLGTCQSCELWSPETFYRLESHYKGRALDEHFNTVGVYTQGALLRDRLGTLNKVFATRAIKRETELLEMVSAYAKGHPDIQFIVFPHPMERRHYSETGEHQFESLAGLPNVTVDFSNAKDSTLQFGRIGLGLTTLSSVGFERIYIGLRTIFYVSDLEYINWDIRSPYHQIFFTEQKSFLSSIDVIRKTTHHEFMKHYFDGGFIPDSRSRNNESKNQ
jgi:hypothetical protein